MDTTCACPVHPPKILISSASLPALLSDNRPPPSRCQKTLDFVHARCMEDQQGYRMNPGRSPPGTDPGGSCRGCEVQLQAPR